MKKTIIVLLFAISTVSLSAQIPEIPPHSVYFVKSDGGWDLYVKKIPGVGSIILTESQRDPEYKVTAYSLRSIAKSSINAAEKRILDGKTIQSRDATVYLIDSNPEKIGTSGEFFHFFLTDEVVFGYPWAREGKLKIAAGVRINARLFEKKYGDYAGRFKDQWIVLTPEALPLAKAEEKPKPAPEKAKVETTIVLLHSSDVDVENAPAPSPSSSPSPSPAPAATLETTALQAAADKLAARAHLSQAATTSYGSLVVARLAGFPYEKILDTQPGESAEIASGEERVLCRFLFAVDKDKNTTNAGFATFHQDERGRLVRINEYGKDNLLSTVYLIDYGNGEEPLSVTPYDRDGKTLPAR